MTNPVKRRTLKILSTSVAGVSAAAVAPFAWSAFNKADNSPKIENLAKLVIKHQWASGKKKLVIDNPTDQEIVVDSISPRIIKSPNGRAIVKIEAPDEKITIPPTSSREFNIAATTANKNDTLKTSWVTDLIKTNLEVRSSNPALANLIPITAFDLNLA